MPFCTWNLNLSDLDNSSQILPARVGRTISYSGGGDRSSGLVEWCLRSRQEVHCSRTSLKNESSANTPNPPPLLHSSFKWWCSMGSAIFAMEWACVKWVIKANKLRKIKFCYLQSMTAEPYLRLCGLDLEEVLRRFLFVEVPRLYQQGSTETRKFYARLQQMHQEIFPFLVA